VKAAPPLIFSGMKSALLIVGTLAGCHVTGGNVANLVTGKFSGRLTAATNECFTLLALAPLTGSLVVKWKSADPATPLLQTSSTVTVSTLSGDVFDASAAEPAFGTFRYGELTFGLTAVSGAFTGGDGGVTSGDRLVVSQDSSALFTSCAVPPGLKTMNLGLGGLTLQ
jgi:hypothetical protein